MVALALIALATTTTAATAATPTPGGFDEFLGIRYGEVPNRFSPAQLATFDPASAKDHGKYGHICMQPVPAQYWPFIDTFMGEDCLFINVHTPSGAAAAAEDRLLPVMLYIHGGGFTGGAGSFYNGSVLAANHGVVVATINYRLGSLGFLSLDELKQSSNQSTGGLNGIRDQVTALHWVQQHISNFGGDPSQVTLFGESAGAESICSLLVSPLAKGLFKRAILES